MAIFSKETLAKFADACASIPLRPLDRAFESAGIRPGKTADDSGGARRTRFRRYLAGIDQRDAKHLQQLGAALGALIDEVAYSKKTFLIEGAERDGFEFADGVFRVASTDANSFAITRLDDAASIQDRIRRLQVLAAERPAKAIAGARQLVESVSRLAGDDCGVRGTGRAVTVIRNGLQQLVDLVQRFDELPKTQATAQEITADHARLAVDSAAAFVTFVAAPRVRA
ncbi:MAG TPA: hypothetical protein VN936_12585 [Candidatus Acidoferrum sp.]|nr:hypothetical protein [Candidatus Acidoferrum sp.]